MVFRPLITNAFTKRLGDQLSVQHNRTFGCLLIWKDNLDLYGTSVGTLPTPVGLLLNESIFLGHLTVLGTVSKCIYEGAAE